MEIDNKNIEISFNIKSYRPNFNVGDIIEIISNIPYNLKDKPRPILGKIISIDGWYVMVKPKYQRYICECYQNEIVKH
jgi:hypothetical protein